jgi:hypothetical protein
MVVIGPSQIEDQLRPDDLALGGGAGLLVALDLDEMLDGPAPHQQPPAVGRRHHRVIEIPGDQQHRQVGQP